MVQIVECLDHRWGGKGVSKAVENINEAIAPALIVRPSLRILFSHLLCIACILRHSVS